jgi:hypothetical protein
LINKKVFSSLIKVILPTALLLRWQTLFQYNFSDIHFLSLSCYSVFTSDKAKFFPMQEVWLHLGVVILLLLPVPHSWSHSVQQKPESSNLTLNHLTATAKICDGKMCHFVHLVILEVLTILTHPFMKFKHRYSHHYVRQ